MGFGKSLGNAIQTRHPDWDGQAFAFDDPMVPAPIQDAAFLHYEPGCKLFYADTKEGGEWWLIDSHGDLIEAFWLER